MLGEALPDAPMVGFDGRAVTRGHAQIFQRDALAVQH